MAKPPLNFTFYIAAPIEKVWNGFVSKEANQTIFMGADFDIDLTPGGAMTWSGPGKDGKPTRYVTGKVIKADDGMHVLWSRYWAPFRADDVPKGMVRLAIDLVGA